MRYGSWLNMLSMYSAKMSGGCTGNSDISADMPSLTRFVAECALPNTFSHSVFSNAYINKFMAGEVFMGCVCGACAR